MTGGTTHPPSDKYIRQASSAPSLHPFLMSNAPPSWEAVTGRHTCFHKKSLLLVILGYSQDVIHQPFRIAWHMSPRLPWSAPTPSLQLMHPGISQRRLGGQQEGPAVAQLLPPCCAVITCLAKQGQASMAPRMTSQTWNKMKKRGWKMLEDTWRYFFPVDSWGGHFRFCACVERSDGFSLWSGVRPFPSFLFRLIRV